MNKECPIPRTDDTPRGIVSHIIYNDLGLCGCTDPATFTMLYEVAKWLDTDWHTAINTWDAGLLKLRTLCHNADYLAFNMLENGGLIEHGGNLIGAWLTPLGKEFIEEFAKLTEQEIEEL